MPLRLPELEPVRRNAILNAALKEFALRGVDDASTNVIAQEAGISKSLMFHYVHSKQELFLFVYDYFTDLLDKEYFGLMDFREKDIFRRLHQSYLLQLDLLKRYPWIFEFSKLSAQTHSPEVNKALEERAHKKQATCYPQMFDDIDESKFRAGLDIEKCKQLIYWSNVGFTNEVLEDIRSSESACFDVESIKVMLDEYFQELRKVFYEL